MTRTPLAQCCPASLPTPRRPMSSQARMPWQGGEDLVDFCFLPDLSIPAGTASRPSPRLWVSWMTLSRGFRELVTGVLSPSSSGAAVSTWRPRRRGRATILAGISLSFVGPSLPHHELRWDHSPQAASACLCFPLRCIYLFDFSEWHLSAQMIT